MKYNRIQEMEDYIRRRKSVSNEDLLEHFNISIQTLRRDLKALEDQGSVSKVYGGVVYKEPETSVNSVNPVSVRLQQASKEKEHIGKLAAEMVENGDVIFIDSGTTAYRMLPYMADLKNVTVISHSLDVMNTLINYPNLIGICAGGTLMTNSSTFLVDTNFYPYNYNKAFIATVGISANRRLTNTNLQEGQMKSHVIGHAKKVYIVADHSKFDIIAFNHFADFGDIDAIITDQCPPDKYLRLFESHQIECIY